MADVRYIIQLGRQWFTGFEWKYLSDGSVGHLSPTWADNRCILIDSIEELAEIKQMLNKVMPMVNPVVHEVKERV